MKVIIFFVLLYSSILAAEQVIEPVCLGNKKNSALIVIDMQEYFVSRKRNDQNAENKRKYQRVINAQIEAIQRAKEAKIPIVFVEYVTKGKTILALRNEVEDYQNVKRIRKSNPGVFRTSTQHRKELVKYLKKKDIGTLIVMGANGGACVRQSIKGALKDNCNLVAFNQGIIDFDSKSFIYPYAGRIQPYLDKYFKISYKKCKNCSFKEVSSLDGVLPKLSNVINVKTRKTSKGNGIR